MTGCSKVSLALICAVVLSIMAPFSQAKNTPADFLIPHNAAREEVGVGALVWDSKLAAYAENYAKSRKEDCKLLHSDGPYGENIFWASSNKSAAGDAVASWVSEKVWYMPAFNSCHAGKVCGHYTQVVWKNSVKLGCATVTCVNGAVFITCNYNPPGNIKDERPYERPY